MRLLHSSSCLVSTYVHMEKTKLDCVCAHEYILALNFHIETKLDL